MKSDTQLQLCLASDTRAKKGWPQRQGAEALAVRPGRNVLFVSLLEAFLRPPVFERTSKPEDRRALYGGTDL